MKTDLGNGYAAACTKEGVALMKFKMVVSGFLCMWAVSQVMMPKPAEAGTWVNGTYYLGGSYPNNWRLLEELFERKEKPTERTGAGSPAEKNAPNPAVCKGGYRWGRVSPGDVITKIYC